MVSHPIQQFLRTGILLLTVSFLLASLLTPPDPLTQVYTLAGTVPAIGVGAYLVAVHTEEEQIPTQFVLFAGVLGAILWTAARTFVPAQQSAVIVGTGVVAMSVAIAGAYYLSYHRDIQLGQPANP